MRWIYISPHLDDAALSAGGWLYDQAQAGNKVEIWTIMCGVPPTKDLSMFAQYLHYQWGKTSAREVVRDRRVEDKNAAAILGAKTRYLDFLDCIYRQDKAGDWLYFEIFVDPLPNESDLPNQIAQTISARLKPDDELICQLGIGKHVDHVTVRRAAELLNRPLHYVADIPYYFNTPEHLNPLTAGMKKKVERVSRAGIRSWKEAILAYESQISSLFKSPRAMRGQINQFVSEFNGMPFWTK
ncbi:MAG: PIG-L family deacetylase [Anaerolineales bacterium]|nr:PIG-L family deacetylase [Anaerolineales bacterium]MCB9144947.1 PIG-L family deacetylase [Anaerolineales bacterium]